MPKRHMITPKQEQVKKTSAEMPCLLKKANFVTLHLIILILSGLFCPQLCYGVDRSIYFFILLFFFRKKNYISHFKLGSFYYYSYCH